MEFAPAPVVFKCGICSKTFKYNKALDFHLQKCHQEPSEYSKDFEVEELNLHNHPSAENSYNSLQMARSASSTWFKDKKNIGKAAKLKCTECGKRFQRPSTLSKHFNQKHPDVYVPSKNKFINFLFCNACHSGFTYRKTLIRHIQDKHPEEMCAEISSQAFNCPVCPVKFEYFVNLKQHMKHLHPGDSQLFLLERSFRHFKCDICKMNFPRRFDLTRHKLREHPIGVAKEMNDSKNFACSFCSKRFSYKYNLQIHSIKKHPNEWKSVATRKPKSYCCAECGKWYSCKMTITNHLRKHHASTIKPSCRRVKDKPKTEPLVESNNHSTRGHRVCPLCSKTFLRKEAIYEHFRAEHDKRIETHSMAVEDEAAFHEWKQRFENEAKCKFVKYNNYKSKKELVKILICHRSGCFQSRSRGVRHLRLNGSEKINGFCPAEVRFVRDLTTDRCSVHYIDEHVGHGPEMQFLKLTEPAKLLESMLEPDCGARGKPNLEDKHLIDTIVLSAWIAENEDSVLYMKGPEEADPAFPELRTGDGGDFVLIVMNEFQATMFAKYAPDIVAVGRADGPRDYGLELFAVVVVDNFRQGIPCCVMLSNRRDQYVFELLFAKVGERAGRVQPRVFMSEVGDTYANAWNAAMPAAHRQLYCAWDVKRRWEKNLSSVACRQRRKATRQLLGRAQTELCALRFNELRQQLGDADQDAFAAYFGQHFARHEAKWAYCYRKYAGINTNYVCDRFFRSLRHTYLRGRSDFSLEQMLDALSMLLASLPQEKLVREIKGKLVAKIKEARARHSMVAAWPAEQINAIDRVSLTKWLVPGADKNEEIYEVERVQDECDCKLVCQECATCLHQYRCTCSDNCIQYNMCVHIHAVCFLEKGIDTSGVCEVIEELIVDVLDAEANDSCSEFGDERDPQLERLEEG